MTCPFISSRCHHVLLLENAIDGGEGGLEKAIITGCDRRDAMRQADLLLALGHRNNLVDLLRQHPIQRLPRTRCQVGQALSVAFTGSSLPEDGLFQIP